MPPLCGPFSNRHRLGDSHWPPFVIGGAPPGRLWITLPTRCGEAVESPAEKIAPHALVNCCGEVRGFSTTEVFLSTEFSTCCLASHTCHSTLFHSFHSAYYYYFSPFHRFTFSPPLSFQEDRSTSRTRIREGGGVVATTRPKPGGERQPQAQEGMLFAAPRRDRAAGVKS